jgi:hypothetical protein
MRLPPHDGHQARFTRERRQPILSAVLAVKPQETPRENSAIQKRTECFFDKSGNRTPFLLSGEESFKLFGDE